MRVEEHFGNLKNKGAGFRTNLFSSNILSLIIISIYTIAMSILKSIMVTITEAVAAKTYSAQHQELC